MLWNFCWTVALVTCYNVYALPYQQLIENTPILRDVQNWGVLPPGMLDKNMLHLEDFYVMDEKQMPSNLKYVKNMRVGLGVPKFENVSMNTFFDKSFLNLKTQAPHLRWITFYDGYAYFPQNGTVDQLHHDIHNLKQQLERIGRLCKKHGIEVETDSKLYINYVFNKTVVMEANIEKFVNDLFGRRNTTTLKANECMAWLEFTVSNIRVNVEFNFADKLSPLIRQDYPHGHSMRHNVVEATTRARIGVRLLGVLLSAFVNTPIQSFQCQI